MGIVSDSESEMSGGVENSFGEISAPEERPFQKQWLKNFLRARPDEGGVPKGAFARVPLLQVDPSHDKN